jgi:hypothetical protein
MPTYRSYQSGPRLRSRSCDGGRHAECGHLLGGCPQSGRRPAPLLCSCGCHSGCPLAGAFPLVTRQVWPAQCICPGTDLAADKLDEAERQEVPDLAEFERQWRQERAKSERESRQRRAAAREAFEAARAVAAGKSRAEIRDIYVAERRARGLTIPSDLALDAYADAIARDRDKFTAVYSVRVLAELGRDFGKLVWRFGRDL